MGSVVLYALPGAIAVGVAATWVSAVRSKVAEAAVDRQIARRSARARGAAREAAEDDRRFAPEHIEAAVERLLAASQAEWRQSFPGARVQQLRLEVLGVINRPGEHEDRLTLRIGVKLRHDRAPRLFWLDPTPWLVPHHVTIDERWTLAIRDGDWALVDRDGDPRARVVLAMPLIAEPAADVQRLSAASLRELAEPPVTDLQWVGHSDDARMELLDRSLVDARFQPALLDAALRRIVEAWELAASGDEQTLGALASDAAVRQLLTPAGRPETSRLQVHDLELVGTEVQRLVGHIVTVSVDLRARRYVIDHRTGKRIAGNPRVTHTMKLQWELELTDDGPAQWRLIASNDPLDACEPQSMSIRAFGATLKILRP